MYIKAVSCKFGESATYRKYLIREIEEVNYKYYTVLDNENLESNLEKQVSQLKKFQYDHGIFYPDELWVDKEQLGISDKSTERENPIETNFKVGAFNCLVPDPVKNPDTRTFTRKVTYMLAGCEVYLLNNDGQTIEKIDLRN